MVFTKICANMILLLNRRFAFYPIVLRSAKILDRSYLKLCIMEICITAHYLMYNTISTMSASAKILYILYIFYSKKFITQLIFYFIVCNNCSSISRCSGEITAQCSNNSACSSEREIVSPSLKN